LCCFCFDNTASKKRGFLAYTRELYILERGAADAWVVTLGAQANSLRSAWHITSHYDCNPIHEFLATDLYM